MKNGQKIIEYNYCSKKMHEKKKKKMNYFTCSRLLKLVERSLILLCDCAALKLAPSLLSRSAIVFIIAEKSSFP